MGGVTMKCKLCKRIEDTKLCPTCKDFLAWIYPGEDSEDVIEKYKELANIHFYLRGRKRK